LSVLEFVDDEAVEDVSVALAYFSDVDFLLNRKLNFRNHYVLLNSDEINPGNIAEAVAGSIAARGVLFANTHPVKHR
jgi:cell cycle checkpoint protein